MDLIGSAQVAKEIGRIAQLGERCPYKAEVTGSIPVPPTNMKIVVSRSRDGWFRTEGVFLSSGLDRRPN